MLGGYDSQTNATFKVTINPYIWWMWMSAYVVVIGALFAVWPGKGKAAGALGA